MSLQSKRKMQNLLIAGNSTMPPSVGIFNLPPLKTCTPSTWCKEHCYALQNRFIWRPTKISMKWRHIQSGKKTFVNKMIGELTRRKSIKYVRPHITGDFYSEEYVCKWAAIAKAHPHRLFRATTRRVDFLLLMKKVFPKNFIVRESTDITRKSSGIFPQAAIYGTPNSDGFFVCIDNCERCNFRCYYEPEINVKTQLVR